MKEIRASLSYGMLAALFIACLGAMWFDGRATGRRQATTAMRDSVRKVQAHLSDSLEHKYHADSLASLKQDSAMQRQKKRYSDLRRPVKVLSDTAIAIIHEGDTTTWTVPKEIPALIRAADTVVIVDSLAIRAKVAEIDDLREDRDVWKRRAQNDEDQIREMKPSRFGLRTGMAIGASLIGLFVYLIK